MGGTGVTALEFITLLAIIVAVPPLFERWLRLPGLVGLILAGYLAGPEILKFYEKADEEVIELFAHIGLIVLMFFAGLEVDLEEFKKVRYRSLTFGLISFALPFCAGLAVGRAYGFDWPGAVLIGSLLGSHTLLALPIARKLGLVNRPEVTAAVGGTIITDIVSLLVLSFAVKLGTAGADQGIGLAGLGLLALKELGFAVLVLVAVNLALRGYFRWFPCSAESAFLVIFLVLLLAADLGALIDIQPIIGAFVAGLATNHALARCRRRPAWAGVAAVTDKAREQLLFIGAVLFIPTFFVDLGIELEVSAIGRDPQGLKIAFWLLGALLAGKFLAALAVKLLFGYRRREMLLMWALSLPQVGATLAAAFLGLETGLITESVLAGVIGLVVVTSVAGPLLFRALARRLYPAGGPPAAGPGEMATPPPAG